mmetsp:Transcript_27138/g.24010  ORF Transcript_27138/g.24010 Transcript_27138/m.24010 type:complete len:199 (-) Transcript_27138:419-1015(-)
MKVIKIKKETDEEISFIINQKTTFQNINSPFVSKLHHRFQTNNKLYFITDLANGSKLSDYMLRKFQLKEKAVRFYAAELVLAIKAMHEAQKFYKGLKPSHVLIDPQGHIKITEPGISVLEGIEELKRKNSGTSNYVAPEILIGNEYSKMNDWWSLGAILYEMISGYPPFLKYSRSNDKRTFSNVTNNQIKSSKRISNA